MTSLIRRTMASRQRGCIGRTWSGVGALALLIGALAVGGVLAAGTGGTAARANPTSTANGEMPGMGMLAGDDDVGDIHVTMTPLTGRPTAEQQAQADAIVGATKKATARFQDVQVALAAGYKQSTGLGSGGFVHFTNDAYANLAERGFFDPSLPPSLLYTKVNGQWKLLGVMYMAPDDYTPNDLAQILPSTIASWHQHHGGCFVGRAVAPVATVAGCAKIGGAWWTRSAWMVHAWIWQPNPDGMFAIKNPTLAAPS